MRNEREVSPTIEKLSMATVVGVDLEWYAPRAAGVSPDSTALLQICSDHDVCAICFMKELGMKMSADLVAFLCNPNIQKVSFVRFGYLVFDGVFRRARMSGIFVQGAIFSLARAVRVSHI